MCIRDSYLTVVAYQIHVIFKYHQLTYNNSIIVVFLTNSYLGFSKFVISGYFIGVISVFRLRATHVQDIYIYESQNCCLLSISFQWLSKFTHACLHLWRKYEHTRV